MKMKNFGLKRLLLVCAMVLCASFVYAEETSMSMDLQVFYDEVNDSATLTWFPSFADQIHAFDAVLYDQNNEVKKIEPVPIQETRLIITRVSESGYCFVEVQAFDNDGIQIEISPREQFFLPLIAEETAAMKMTSMQSMLLGAGQLDISLVSCDSHNFPSFIYVTVRVNEDGQPAIDLTKDNFSVTEDGIAQTDLFDVTPPGAGGGVRMADIIFLIDTSGSMGGEIAAVRNNCVAFANALVASDIDYRLGLVRFGNSSGANPGIIGGGLTDNANTFKSWVGTLGASGGYEPGFGAIRLAIQNYNFRPGAQKVFILITDEDSDDRDKTSTINLILANDVTVHCAVNCGSGNSNSDYCGTGSIRDVSGGLLFSVMGNYSEILDTIRGELRNTYIIEYRPSNSAFDGIERQVKGTVDNGVSSDFIECSYTPGGSPRIDRTSETKALHNLSQVADTQLTIAAEVKDTVVPLVQSVTLYVRTSGSGSNYTAINMADQGNNIYSAQIPASIVQQPGVDYYIRATDGQVASTDPKTNPSGRPYQLGVLPNVKPVIEHTPPESATAGQDRPLSIRGVDQTYGIKKITLYYYEQISDLIPTEIVQKEYSAPYPTDVTESLTISGSFLVEPRGKYIIEVEDDLGLTSYWPSDSPDVFHELPVLVEGRLYGIVEDGHGNRLPYVKVKLKIPLHVDETTWTDADGNFEFVDAPDQEGCALRVDLEYRPPWSNEYLFAVKHNAGRDVFIESDTFNPSNQNNQVILSFGQASLVPYNSGIVADRYDDLATTYWQAADFWNFVHSELNHIPSFDLPLLINCYRNDNPNGAYYAGRSGDPEIYIGTNLSTRNAAGIDSGNQPMNLEWHESGHYLQDEMIGLGHRLSPGESEKYYDFGWDGTNGTGDWGENNGRYDRGEPFDDFGLDRVDNTGDDGENDGVWTGDINHFGYRNHSTGDSWGEGWAEFWSIACNYSKDPAGPNWDIYAGFGSLEENRLAWGIEEFAVAGLLLDLIDGSGENGQDSIQITVKELWDLVSTDDSLDDFKDVYDALVAASIGQNDTTGSGHTDLDDLFIAHGFFADVDGSKSWDAGEEIGRAADQARPNRRNHPTVEGAYIYIVALTPLGLPVTGGQCQIEMSFSPPWQEYNSVRAFPLSNEGTKLLYLDPGPLSLNPTITINVADSQNNWADEISFTRDQYRDVLEDVLGGYAITHEFVIDQVGITQIGEVFTDSIVSNPVWFSAYIELLPDAEESNIDLTQVRIVYANGDSLNPPIFAASDPALPFVQNRQTTDQDTDGKSELMVKFSQPDVLAAILGSSPEIAKSLTFRWIDTNGNTKEGTAVLDLAPIANAGYDQDVPGGSSGSANVELDGSGSSDPEGAPLTYSWSENGSLIATGETPTEPLTTGTHLIALKVNDGLLNSNYSEVVINVLPNNEPTADAGLDQPTVERTSTAGAEVTLDGSGSNDPDGDPLTYAWTWDSGSASGVSPAITLPMGLTTVTLAVSDGALSDSDTVDITVIDTTAPEVVVVVPIADTAVQDGVTLSAQVTDLSEVTNASFTIRERDGADGTPVGFEDLSAAYNATTDKWEHAYDSTQLPDGYYIIFAKAIDEHGNEGISEVVPFSIRNWAVVELLPASRRYRAGRTMPIKFSLRISEAVDPAMPFVYNEDLRIDIYKTSEPGTILKSALFGEGSTAYRIESDTEHDSDTGQDIDTEYYITNYKTARKPAEYTVEIWRIVNDFFVDSFTFKTARKK